MDDCQPITWMAPSFMERFSSGIISSGSNSILYPRPAQTGQAPKGLLKEKLLGSISLMLIPQSGQAKFSENLKVSPPITSTSRSPSAMERIVSMESVILFSIPGLTTSRSTIMEMVCLMFLSNLISSESSYMFPSTITLTYPALEALSKTLACSPFLPCTTGARS